VSTSRGRSLPPVRAAKARATDFVLAGDLQELPPKSEIRRKDGAPRRWGEWVRERECEVVRLFVKGRAGRGG
jgi:hypothetical protein